MASRRVAVVASGSSHEKMNGVVPADFQENYRRDFQARLEVSHRAIHEAHTFVIKIFNVRGGDHTGIPPYWPYPTYLKGGGEAESNILILN